MAVKLDSSKDIYRGELFVFAKPDGSESDEPLAFATTATLEITTEEVDISNKMMGGWAGSLPGKKSYTVSSEALITRKEGALSYDTLLKAQIDGKVLDFFSGRLRLLTRTTMAVRSLPTRPRRITLTVS